LKGRYDEPKNQAEALLDDLNDYNRQLYRDEVATLIARISAGQKAGQPELYTPHIRFNRNIGRHAGQKFHSRSGEPMDDRAYEAHVEEFMPSAKDRKLLLDILEAEKNWITPRVGVRDPLETIGEPRKSAMTTPIIN
jgi:hypothetical protein